MTRNTKAAVKFWLRCSKDNFDSAEAMLQAGRWSFSMFMCQQSIEALLKGAYITLTGERPLYIHNLAQLLDHLKIDVPKYIIESISKINAHYIKARYKNDRFDSKIYNRRTASSLLKRTQQVLQWFTKKLNLKI